MDAGIISLLRRLWNSWKRVAAWIARVQTAIILGVIYVVVLGVIAMIAKLVRRDLLHKRLSFTSSYWITREAASRELEDFQRQF